MVKVTGPQTTANKTHFGPVNVHYIDDLVQDRINSSASAMELLQSCTKPSI